MKKLAHQMLKKSWYICLLLFIFPAICCAKVPQDSTSQPASDVELKQELNQIKAWKIKGAISIRRDKHTDMASVTWYQNEKHNYMITLSGPLSMGATRITGHPNHVTLWKSKKAKYSAKSPEQLMRAQLGWQIPLSNMYYWARALPAPGIHAQALYDDAHHLVHLIQEGWDIQYLEFTNVNGIDLPKKMLLLYPNLAIKFVIKQWTF